MQSNRRFPESEEARPADPDPPGDSRGPTKARPAAVRVEIVVSQEKELMQSTVSQRVLAGGIASL